MILDLFVDRFKAEMKSRGFNTVYDVMNEFPTLCIYQIVNCMSGGKVPSARKLANICFQLGLSADYLFGFIDENRKPSRDPQIDERGFFETIKERSRVSFGDEPLDALAEKAGVKTTALSGLKSKGQPPAMDSLYKICKTRNISLDWLLGLSDTE